VDVLAVYFHKETAQTVDAIKESLISQLQALLNEIDAKEWNDMPICLERNSQFEAFSSILMAARQSISEDSLIQSFESVVAELEEKEPRLKEGQADLDWNARRISWESFKQKIRDFPVCIHFDNENIENRKKQYYELGVRFVKATLKLSESDEHEYALDNIDRQGEQSFLDTCRTGWNIRIAQLENMSHKDDANLHTLAWELSKDTRRSLLKKYVSTRIESDVFGADVHGYEKAIAATNKIFHLGYAHEDLGIEQADSDFEGINFLDLYAYFEDSFNKEYLEILQEKYGCLSDEQRSSIFAEVLDRYFEIVTQDESLLIDDWDDARIHFNDLEEWINRHGIYSKDAINELIPIRNSISAFVEHVSFDASLSYRKFFSDNIQNTSTYTRMGISSYLPVDNKIEIFKSKIKQQPSDVQALFEERLFELDQLRSLEKIEQDFHKIKSDITRFKGSFTALRAAKNRAILENKLLTHKKFGSIAWAVVSKSLNVFLAQQNTAPQQILSWMQHLPLTTDLTQTILRSTSAYVGCLQDIDIKQALLLMIQEGNIDEILGSITPAYEGSGLLEDIRSSNMKNIVSYLRHNSLDGATWLDALRVSSEEDKDEIASLLLEKKSIQGFSSEEIALIHTLSHNVQIMCVKICFMKGLHSFINEFSEQIVTEGRGKAVCFAAQNNNLEMVRLLLNGDNEIPDESRSEGVMWAAHNNNEEMFSLLFAEEKDISMESRGGAVICAAVNNNMSMLSLLLANGREISTVDVSWAIREAIRNDNLPMFVLLHSRVSSFLQEDIGEFVKLAAKNNNIDMIRLLLADDTGLTTYFRGCAVISAVENNNLEMAALLLADDKEIADMDRNLAVQNAASMEMIRLLISQGATLHLHPMQQGLQKARENNNAELTQFFEPIVQVIRNRGVRSYYFASSSVL
ncbi:MAG: ankyrin repeat domain-containing protein, partial [Chlamydiae bacterium]|nr:ankyrin repeat domain-containing protein [Chlamydiota bacterium]